MVKIHGVIYLIIGSAVAGFAKFVEAKTNAVGMTLFFYVGLVFVAIGIFKIVSRTILRGLDESHKDLKTTMDDTIRKLNINKDLSAVQKAPPQTPMVVACPKCGTRHYSTSNFCHKCGTLLKS